MATRANQRAPRTLAEDLRGRSDDALTALFTARPDLSHPTPTDMTQVASRAASRTSVTWAVDRLDLATIRVLAAVAADDTTTPAAVRAAVDAPASRVDGCLARLLEVALVWGSDDALHAVREAAEVVRAVEDPLPEAPVGSPPALTPRPSDGRRLDALSAGAATELVQRVDALLASWSANPPSVLRSGGLGVRDVRAAASLLGVSSTEVDFLVSLARTAGLLARGDGGGDEAWMPTTAFDGWRQQGVGERWAVLAEGWRDSPGRAVRRLVLRVLASVRPDGFEDPDDVLRAVAWHAPRVGDHREPMALQALAEGARLGVVVDQTLSVPGEALLGDGAARAMAALMPPPVDHLLLQADLTAVAPGPLEPALARQLEEVADTESTGGASVYRFTDGSVRRALELGWPAARIHAFLADHSRTPVPQPLTYLVDDAARRHGQVRVGRSAGYLRCDDPTELDAIVADATSLGLSLQRLAPTVAVSELPADLVLERLRGGGHRAVGEGSDGSIESARPRPRRARPPEVEVRSGSDPAGVVAAVRAGDAAAQSRPVDAVPAALAHSGSLEAVAALREAAESRASVWLSYMDQAGSATERIVDPVRVDAGWLTAYDHRSGRVQTFALHRVGRVAPTTA
ncbi:helicase C-terminal domain-containing protein [Solicola sp. PLA-1-18]|uniref:helicase C-terminal domain-containing protein n=1 Tax=Solicola sp. PLA-1-18 TaxID=3380532 RepID=UPI003B7FEE64